MSDESKQNVEEIQAAREASAKLLDDKKTINVDGDEFQIKRLSAVRKKTMSPEAMVEALKFHPVEKLGEIFEYLPPELQAKICLDLTNYFLPKKRAIEHSGSDEGSPIRFEGSSIDLIKQIRASS